MKDLLKTYSPVAFVLAGALGYWSIGSVGAMKDQVAAMQEQTRVIILAASGNCEALSELVPEEESEDASTADTP